MTHLKELIITVSVGVLLGYSYGGYRYYGTIDPRKHTYEQLINHTTKKRN